MTATVEAKVVCPSWCLNSKCRCEHMGENVLVPASGGSSLHQALKRTARARTCRTSVLRSCSGSILTTGTMPRAWHLTSTVRSGCNCELPRHGTSTEIEVSADEWIGDHWDADLRIGQAHLLIELLTSAVATVEPWAVRG